VATVPSNFSGATSKKYVWPGDFSAATKSGVLARTSGAGIQASGTVIRNPPVGFVYCVPCNVSSISSIRSLRRSRVFRLVLRKRNRNDLVARYLNLAVSGFYLERIAGDLGDFPRYLGAVLERYFLDAN
jgi:hypothetical protein